MFIHVTVGHALLSRGGVERRVAVHIVIDRSVGFDCLNSSF